MENIVPYYGQNIRLKCIHYTSCLNLSSVGKRLKKSMQQVLALRQNICLNICDYFKNMSKAQRFNFTYRAYGKRSRWGSNKITITNASIDKQITLKVDYIYKIENTDLEIGVSGVSLRILFYFEARRCSRQTDSVYALRINLLNIMIQKTLLRGRGTTIIMKLNESTKEVKNKKIKEFTWSRTQDLWL